jgi:eukaryotic-like serine/threonine-protein kinase
VTGIDTSAHASAAQSPPIAGEPAIGQLGRYRLIKSLGVGGQAEVFKARYSGPGGFERTVVIKRILPANCEDPEFIRMFAAEARILGMLHHPNVVQAYDVGESDGVLFLVLEYVDGPSLGRLLRALRGANRPMSPELAAYFALELCRALDYVHRLRNSDGEPLNVIHRDVTPSNVVLTTTGSVKLLDFGIAKYGSSGVQTHHRVVKGKPAYLAPEAIEGRAVDARLDLFSIGVVLHEMLALKPLFGADHELAILHKVLEMPIPRPSETRADVPPALDAIVMKALQRDPALRYGSAAEMAGDLDALVGARVRVDDVVRFLRDVEPLLNTPAPSLTAFRAERLAMMPTEPAAPAPRTDLLHRLRMSSFGRFFLGDRRRAP